jgi:hypothetical protein
MEWIIFPIIWAFMVGGVVVHNEKVEDAKNPHIYAPLPEIPHDPVDD